MLQEKFFITEIQMDTKTEKYIQEDGAVVVPTNSAGSGAVAGIGVGPNGEPGVNKKKKLTPFMSFIKRKSPK